ncbi:hypothetical protein F5Y11DRAFT_364052 [Daldinia sp. FL1419]|nr:hypothetical protein F5Y11DRAFT_364052 [Daldinia sp. FL1419]
MSSGAGSDTTISIVPNGTDPALRERFNREIVLSRRRETHHNRDNASFATNVPPSSGYTPSGPPPPYTSHPMYAYPPNPNQPVPQPRPYYPNTGPGQSYPGPPPGYHNPTSYTTWPQHAAPPRMMDGSTAPCSRARTTLTPNIPESAAPNPFLYLQQFAPQAPYANPPAPRRTGHQNTASTASVNLNERPENASFINEHELNRWMTGAFRPLVGVVGRIVQEELELREQPKVKFQMYPVKADSTTGEPEMAPHSTSRAPMFQVTLPAPGRSRADLQKVRDVLFDELAMHTNAWHRQAGLVFRISRRHRVGSSAHAKRYWVPPSCVYRFSRGEQCYVANPLSPALDDVRRLDASFTHGDDSDDDQDVLVEDMWRDVRAQGDTWRQGRAFYNDGSEYM